MRQEAPKFCPKCGGSFISYQWGTVAYRCMGSLCHVRFTVSYFEEEHEPSREPTGEGEQEARPSEGVVEDEASEAPEGREGVVGRAREKDSCVEAHARLEAKIESLSERLETYRRIDLMRAAQKSGSVP